MEDDVDAFLEKEFLRESRMMDMSRAKRVEFNAGGESEEEEAPEVIEPGFAPRGMFSAENLRNSVMLGAPVRPQNPQAPISVRVSQLVPGRVENTLGDLRATQVRNNLQSFKALVGPARPGGGGGSNILTQSQSVNVNIYLGSFGEMLSKIEILIQNNIDNEEQLATLLELHEGISTALREHNMHPSQLPGGGERGSQEPPVWIPPEEEEPFDWNRWMNDEEPGFNAAPAAPAFPAFVEPEVESDHEDAEQLECLICMDDIWFPSRKSHRFTCCNSTYCRNCLAENYEVAINDGRVLELKCPNPTCAAILTEEDISKIVKEEVFRRYQQFYFLASLRKDPTVRWCPTQHCETPVRGGSAENDHLTCEKCKTEFCWKCNCPWHPTKSCAWAQKRAQRLKGASAKQDKKAEQAIKKNARPCPQCQAPIQKNSGCNHMTCINCKYQFCWVCMGHFEGYGHFSQGKCKGLQYNSSNWSKYGMYAGIGVGGIAAIGIAIPVVAIAAPPVAAVGLPILGAFALATKLFK